MSVLNERFLIFKYGSENEIKKLLRKESFLKEYSSKKYNKLNFNFLNKLYKTKFCISINNFQMLKTKTLLLLFICIKTLFQLKQNKKNKKELWIKKSDLLKIGFKNSSLKTGIKKLLDLGLINKKIYKNQNLIKLNQTGLKTKQHIYIKIENQTDWNIFLLFGLKTLYVYKILKYKSSFLKKNNFNDRIVLQNKLFGFHRNSIYQYLKSICKFLMLKFKNLFGIFRRKKKVFITYSNSKKHKFIKNKFITERILLMRI